MVKKYFENLAKALLNIRYTDLDEHEKNVIQAIAKQETVVTDLNESFKEQLTFGQRIADRVAVFGGSWTFIIIFMSIMVIWMVTNTILLAADKTFDPYPFILLNLGLSSLAALQAPIIMMSQNRQSDKDRMAATLNYEVSLKTDLEIMRLHQRLDELISQKNSNKEEFHDGE
ncbi:DUF1003 domain-containing protein [Alteromonadaceae bacterium M269]|jgi:uncharacterized membrane protein|nr:DUF1003 domain-containing protein [Alteromonadaceae bacterium M269]